MIACEGCGAELAFEGQSCACGAELEARRQEVVARATGRARATIDQHLSRLGEDEVAGTYDFFAFLHEHARAVVEILLTIPDAERERALVVLHEASGAMGKSTAGDMMLRLQREWGHDGPLEQLERLLDSLRAEIPEGHVRFFFAGKRNALVYAVDLS